MSLNFSIKQITKKREWFSHWKFKNLEDCRSGIDGLVDCLIYKHILFNVYTTHLLPVRQRNIGCPGDILAAPID